MKKPTWGCTKAQIAALDYIGSHRKTRTYPHRPTSAVSMRVANKLVSLHWAMWLSDGSLILTAAGERLWKIRHPYSKKYPV